MYKKIEKLMQERNITSYRLSKDTGIPNVTIRSWKTGRSKPKADKLLKLAEYFGVSVEYFFKP